MRGVCLSCDLCSQQDDWLMILSHDRRDANCDESVAEYATALAAKGSDRQKIEKSLGALLGISTAGDMCEW